MKQNILSKNSIMYSSKADCNLDNVHTSFIHPEYMKIETKRMSLAQKMSKIHISFLHSGAEVMPPQKKKVRQSVRNTKAKAWR
jgi:hypothetical protein